MHTRISLALAALMGAPACGAPDEATEPRADRDIREGAEPIGVTQQRRSPIGLGCGLFMFGATMIATSALCPRARGPGRAQRCSDYSGAALGSIGVLCAFL